MPIHFDEKRWESIRKSYGDWWAHCSQRPLISVRLMGYDPGRPQPEAPVLSQQTALDLSWTPDQLIDRMDYELSKIEFLGDAYPYVKYGLFWSRSAGCLFGGNSGIIKKKRAKRRSGKFIL